jgi:hypothetical protein
MMAEMMTTNAIIFAVGGGVVLAVGSWLLISGYIQQRRSYNVYEQK